MFNQKSITIIILTIISLTLCGYGYDVDMGKPQNRLQIGPGFIHSTTVYRGDNDETWAIPLIYYDSPGWFLAGRKGGYHIYKSGIFSVDLIAQWRFDGFEDDDSAFLNGMDDRDMTVDGGIALNWKTGIGSFSASFVNDLLGKHDGHEILLEYGKRFRRDKFSFRPAAGISYESKNLSNYYYEVRSGEATAARPEYHPGETWNPYVSMQATYQISEKWSALAIASLKWLDSDISNSPIVDESHETAIMAGLMYNF